MVHNGWIPVFNYLYAADSSNLEERLRGLAKGIGPATIQIFLREAYEALPETESLPSNYEVLAARNFGITSLKGETVKELRLILNTDNRGLEAE